MPVHRCLWALVITTAVAASPIEREEPRAAAAEGVSPAVEGASSAPFPPNIVFIVVDDLGFGDLGFTGSAVRTPNIDALLSRDGVRLTRYYGQPVCTPSRAALHTGRLPLAMGLQSYVIPDGADYGMDLNETTLPSLLRDRAGYASHAVGKWHLGEASWAQTPTFRGYNSFHGYYSGGQDYYTHSEGGGYDFRIDASPRCGAGCSVVDYTSNGTYSTHVFAAAAVDVIATHDQARGPLFLYFATQAVHSPRQVPQSYIDPYNATIPSLERRVFAGMLSALDEAVGNVTAALAAAGGHLASNTLVVLVADNGGPIACDDTTCSDATGASNFPLRGGKHSLWEGGVRLTALASGPMINAAAPGGNNSGLFHHVDWLPTLLEAAGVAYTPAPGFELHGASQWPLLTRGAPSSRREVVLNIDPAQPEASRAIPWGAGNAAILTDDGWKLHLGLSGPPWGYSQPDGVVHAATAGTGAAATAPPFVNWPLKNMTAQLFNVLDDEGETTDVAAAHPDVVANLTARLAVWGKAARLPYWVTARAVDPRSAPSRHNGTWTPWL